MEASQVRLLLLLNAIIFMESEEPELSHFWTSVISKEFFAPIIFHVKFSQGQLLVVRLALNGQEQEEHIWCQM